MAHSSRPRATSRRRFLGLAGAAGLSAALSAPMLAAAQSSSRTRGTPKPKAQPLPVSPAAPDTSKAEKPSEFVDDAKALTAVIQRRYGKYLNQEQLAGITEELDNRMQGGKLLRAAKLSNGDEPEFTFRA